MTRTILVFAAALLTASPAAADLCSVQWLQQASGRDVQRHVQASSADVNRVCNNFNSRPLHLALTFDDVGSDVVQALLNAGADAEQANSFGDSPRTLADAAREEGRLSAGVHDLFRRRFEARAEAARQVCDPGWWRGFYRLDRAAAERRVQAVLRNEGLDVNMDCDGGNRPLHYALQDSLTPLTEGAYWGIATFMFADGVELGARNGAGRSVVDLLEARYDIQVRGNYVNVLRRFCRGRITAEEYRRQYYRNYGYEAAIYAELRKLHFNIPSKPPTDRLKWSFMGSTPMAQRPENSCARSTVDARYPSGFGRSRAVVCRFSVSSTSAHLASPSGSSGGTRRCSVNVGTGPMTSS